MQAALVRWLAGAGLVLALVIAIVILYQNNKALGLERDAADARAGRFEQALEAYRTQFAAQVKSLNAEKRAEIIRHENLLKTFNLIGDLTDEENGLVPDSSLRVIDSLYAPAE